MATQSETVQPASAKRTTKADRTRATLLDASLVVFERDGFHSARVADIAKEAGVAHGTFYTYYTSKADIFRTLMAKMTNEAYGPDSGHATPDLSTLEHIRAANKRFLDAYRENAGAMGLIESTATYDGELKEIRNDYRTLTCNGVRAEIERLQAVGVAAATVDADCAASALVSMRSNFAYFWFVMEQSDYDEATVLDTLTHIWAAALGVTAHSAPGE